MIRAKFRTSDDRLYLHSGQGIAIVSSILIANTTASRITFRLHHVRPGETSVTANAIFYDTAIAPNSSLLIENVLTIESGEELRGMASAAGVTFTMYGTT